MTKLIIIRIKDDKIVKRLSFDYELEEWQKLVILNDFCEINDLNYLNYSYLEIK